MANQDISTLIQCKLGTGSIITGNTPDAEDLAALKQLDISHIVTLLTADEDAEQIREAIVGAGFHSRWFPVTAAVEESETECEHFRQYVQELSELLSEGGNIYLHDGVSHTRAALIVFAMLHLRGIPSASAWTLLSDLTHGAARNVSRPELQWAAALGTSLR